MKGDRKGRARGGRADRPEGAGPGAWLPWPAVEALCRLHLRPASRWQVFLAVLATSARYGGREAKLAVGDLTRMTGLSERTVKAALAGLIESGLVSRAGRYRRLAVNLPGPVDGRGGANLSAPPKDEEADEGGADKLAPPKGEQACTSPTCFHVSSSSERERSSGPTFTTRQQALIRDVLAESSDLLGSDASELPLPARAAARVGVPAETTYGAAYEVIARAGDAVRARDLTRAVLDLRRDPRVQGSELH